MSVRRHEIVSGFDIFEPATDDEFAYLMANLSSADADEVERFGLDAASGAADTWRDMRRRIAIFRNGSLMCVAGISDEACGRVLTCTTTRHALEMRNAVSWIRSFPSFAEWFMSTDDKAGRTGRFLAACPEDKPRAFAFYRRAGAVRIGSFSVLGRKFSLIEMKRKED